MRQRQALPVESRCPRSRRASRLTARRGDPREHRPGRRIRGARRRAIPLRRGGRGAAGRSAPRLPGVLVQLALPDSGAGRSRLPRRRAGHARLQPLVAPGGRRALRHRPAGGRRPRPDPRARRRPRLPGRPRLGRRALPGRRRRTTRRRWSGWRSSTAPIPRRMLRALRRPRQLARSWYMFFFQLPWLPERLLSARGWSALRRAFDDARPGAFTPQDIARYVEAWSQPGAATAMLNYYRAAFRQTAPRQGADRPGPGPDPGHLGRARSPRRPRAGRARPCRRPQPGARRAPARRLALGAARRARAGGATADRVLRGRGPSASRPPDRYGIAAGPAAS